jgi:hypothetical protein
MQKKYAWPLSLTCGGQWVWWVGPHLSATAEPFLDESSAGLADGIVMQTDFGTDLEVGPVFGRQREGPYPQRFVAFARAGLSQLLQRISPLHMPHHAP